MKQFNDLSNFFSLAERMFDQPEQDWSEQATASWSQTFRPTMDVSETAEYYFIEMELPGINPDSLNVAISDNTLHIEGEKANEDGDQNRDYHRVERSYGNFSRQIRLPNAASSSDIEATYRHGILELRVPKTQEARPQQIDVTVEEN